MATTKTQVTLVLEDEDFENIQIALGVALASLGHDHFADRELTRRSMRRIDALHVALANAQVRKLP
jgi:hypothetical protein